MFARTLFLSAPVMSAPANQAALSAKSQELFHEAQTFIADEKHEEAERALESAILLLRKSLGLAPGSADTSSSPALALFCATLAFSKQSLEKYDEADALYQSAIPVLRTSLWKDDHRDLGLALANYAEVHAMRRQFTEAKKTCEEACRILKQHFGEKNEVYAGTLSNLAAYLCQLGLYNDAKPVCRDALKVMMDLLGRDNDYTKSCWSNYYIILKKLNLKDELADLETDWKAADEVGGWATGDKPVPPEMMEHLKQKLEERLTPPAPLDVGGFVKDPSFAKKELEQFVEETKKKGIQADDPAFLDVLEHEVSAIMDGQHKSVEALQAATERVSSMAEKMGPEWRRFVQQILIVAPTLEEASQSIQKAGGLDPEYVQQEEAAAKAEIEGEQSRKEALARAAVVRAERAHIIEAEERKVRAENRGSQFDD